ncbi:MAG: class I SAM-dependent methyltransferase [Treponema sp.]|jgi:23S rRNA G2069 N7-methylase RlmK/C1962 C5-methylase RlmI|nr:class I SAM-dependent methyltransferase [Treponema sp.]
MGPVKTKTGHFPNGAAGEKTKVQAEMLFNRLRKRQRHLKKWARRIGTDAYRLYDRDIPEIPLLIDYYGGALAGALFKRPYEKAEDEEERWLIAMKAAASRALDIPGEYIFFRERRRIRFRGEGGGQYERQGTAAFTRNIQEGGLRFRVNLSDYLDTGFFPDRRRMRGMIRSEAAGKRSLNLFCYTASFSVCAAAGGAAEVDSVDMSNTYLNWGRENFALNGFNVPGSGLNAESGPDRSCILAVHFSGKYEGIYRFIRADVFRFLEEARRRGRRWDQIILDPPVFSNSKRMSRILDLDRDHPRLIAQCAALLAPGGKLWFSARLRSGRIVLPDLPGLEREELSASLEDEDFRGKRTPPCYTYTR